MIPQGAEPVVHQPVYKRIDLNPPVPITKAPAESWSEAQARIAAESKQKSEAEGIWRLVRQYCGDNIAGPEPPKPNHDDYAYGLCGLPRDDVWHDVAVHVDPGRRQDVMVVAAYGVGPNGQPYVVLQDQRVIELFEIKFKVVP
jgi:hypothetical protein